jgi:hypothetical protein
MADEVATRSSESTAAVVAKLFEVIKRLTRLVSKRNHLPRSLESRKGTEPIPQSPLERLLTSPPHQVTRGLTAALEIDRLWGYRIAPLSYEQSLELVRKWHGGGNKPSTGD